MRSVRVNDYNVHLLTNQEVKDHDAADHIVYNEAGINLYFTGTRGDLYRAAGLEIPDGQFDFSLPQDWVYEQRKKDPNFNTSNYIWSFHRKTIFGEPIYMGGASRQLFLLAISGLLQGKDINQEWKPWDTE